MITIPISIAAGIFARRLAGCPDPGIVVAVGEKTPEHARAIPLLAAHLRDDFDRAHPRSRR